MISVTRVFSTFMLGCSFVLAQDAVQLPQPPAKSQDSAVPETLPLPPDVPLPTEAPPLPPPEAPPATSEKPPIDFPNGKKSSPSVADLQPLLRDDVANDAKSLMQLRKELANDLESSRKQLATDSSLRAPNLFPNPANDQESATDRLRKLIDEITELSSTKKQRVGTLQEKVLELQTLLKQNRESQPIQIAPSTDVAQPGAEEKSESNKTPADPQVDPQKSQPTEKPNADATPVGTSAAVDRLALADNLFGSRKFKLACDIYESLLTKSPNSKDSVWLRYQIACCHRKLGDRGEAKKYYRLVSGQTYSQVLANNSRWWLDRIEQRQQLEQLVSQLKQSRKSLQEQANATGGQ